MGARWRYIVFTSPHRLDLPHLRFLCTTKRPLTKTLGVRPEFLITIREQPITLEEQDASNTIAVREQHDRVSISADKQT